jgi:hypothetical protein
VRWSPGRRWKAEQRDAWLAEQQEYAALLEPVIAAADFGSWSDFYDGDTRRRAGEITIGDVVDGELCWHIVWVPTTEVVAWPFRWRDERRHRRIYGQVEQRTLGPSHMGVGRAAIPEMIYVVGRAEAPNRAGLGSLRRRLSQTCALLSQMHN